MVAIKDFGIPSCCMNCEMFRVPDGEVVPRCVITGHIIDSSDEYLDKRADDCPLVEIITCKDCKHKVFLASDGKGNTTYMCDKHCKNITNEDYYCADGERRK